MSFRCSNSLIIDACIVTGVFTNLYIGIYVTLQTPDLKQPTSTMHIFNQGPFTCSTPIHPLHNIGRGMWVDATKRVNTPADSWVGSTMEKMLEFDVRWPSKLQYELYIYHLTPPSVKSLCIHNTILAFGYRCMCVNYHTWK